jgi:hypothetical protein
MTSRADVPDVFRFTVSPRRKQSIALTTLPNARCVLTSPESGSEGLVFYSDPTGVARLHLDGLSEHEAIPMNLRAENTDDGSWDQVLELRCDESPTDSMPPPPDGSLSDGLPDGAKVVAGLSEREQRDLGNEDLIARGYPPRPDESNEPDEYRRWKNFVSEAFTHVEPHLVPSDVSATPTEVSTDDHHWAGVVLPDVFDFTFQLVSAMWQAPNVTPMVESVRHHCSVWVGIDGVNRDALVQGGTAHECFQPSGSGVVSSHYAWTQLLPGQQYEQMVNNFPIRPNDSVSATVWLGSETSFSLSGPSGVVALLNETTRQATTVVTPVGTAHFVGSDAEFIVERVGDIYLANFDFLNFYNPVVQSTSGGPLVAYLDRPQLTLYSCTNDKGKLLAKPDWLPTKTFLQIGFAAAS